MICSNELEREEGCLRVAFFSSKKQRGCLYAVGWMSRLLSSRPSASIGLGLACCANWFATGATSHSGLNCKPIGFWCVVVPYPVPLLGFCVESVIGAFYAVFSIYEKRLKISLQSLL